MRAWVLMALVLTGCQGSAPGVSIEQTLIGDGGRAVWTLPDGQLSVRNNGTEVARFLADGGFECARQPVTEWKVRTEFVPTGPGLY